MKKKQVEERIQQDHTRISRNDDSEREIKVSILVNEVIIDEIKSIAEKENRLAKDEIKLALQQRITQYNEEERDSGPKPEDNK